MKINYVKTFESLFKLMNSRYEIILYPVGNAGRMFLEFFEYQNLITRFCCIARKKSEKALCRAL